MKRLVLLVLMLMGVPAIGKTQDPDMADIRWMQLSNKAAGRKVQVMVNKDVLIKGTFLTASPDSLLVRRGNTDMPLDRASIRNVRVFDESRRKRNMILYGSIGAVAGLIPGATFDAYSRNEYGTGGWAAPTFAAIGFGIGALAVSGSGYETVYGVGAKRTLPLKAVGAFDELRTQVGPRDKVTVIDVDGRRIAGRVVELTATSLSMDVGGSTTVVSPNRIKTVLMRRPDSRKNGALWGLAAGAAFGIGATAGQTNDGYSIAFSGGFFGGIGAAVGAIVDGLHQGTYRVYDQQVAPKTSVLNNFKVAPVLSKARKGVAVSISF